MDQEQQSSKSKRSSILKPAKPRNPLVDVDIKYPPVPIETTFMRSRRVSFASNNFIKEFTTDPEKNTIWHVSYEEANRSDHSAPQTSSDNNDDASDDFNCTKIGEIDMSMVSPLDSSPIVYTNNIVSTKNFPVVLKDTNIIRQTVNYIQDNMELTYNHLNPQDINSEKPTELDMSLEIENPEVMLDSNRQTIHFNQESNTGLMAMSETIPRFNMETHENLGTNRQIIHGNDDETIGGEIEVTEKLTNFSKVTQQAFNFSHLKNRNIEVTKTIHGFVNLGNKDYQHPERQPIHFTHESTLNDLQLPQLIPNTKRQTFFFNQESNSGDLEITQSLPTHIIRSKNEIIHYDTKPTTNITEINLTHNAFVNSKDIQSSKRQTIHYNPESNPDYIPDQNKLIHTEEISNSKQLTTHFNHEIMNMTETIPTHTKFVEKINNLGSKRQTIHYNQESNTDHMDMTEAIPDLSKMLNKENIPSTKRLTIHFNQESNPGTMDMTETIPAHIKFPNNYNICTSNRQTINYNQELNSDRMDMTQIKQNELLNKENIPSTKRLTIHFNQESNPGTMDMTKIMPDPVKLSPNQSVIQYNQKSNIGSDFKQQTLTSNNQELYMGDMEFTQAIPSINNLQINIPSNTNVINKEINKRQSIIYHQESNVGNMEMTQSIPIHTNLEKDLPSYSNVVNNENNPSTKRKTVLYNQESDMGIIECTRVISKDDLMLNINNKSTNCEEIKLNQISDSNNKPNICVPMSINQNSTHDLTPVITAEPEVFAKYQNNEFKMSETDLLDSTQFTSEPPISSTRIENNLSTDYNIKNIPKIVLSISNDNDICQRIKFPGETFDTSKMQLEKLNFTPAPSNLSHKSLNTINLSTDNTEKLINFQIGGNPMSEYSKIINDDVNLPSLLCMTGGNCFNVSENVDAKFNHTEFHSLLLDTSKDIEDAPKNVNNIETSLNNGEIQNELQDNCKLAGEDCARNIYIPIPDPNLNHELQNENCVRNIEDYNAIANSNCKPAEIKPMVDKQIVNKRTSIERMGSVSNKKCNTSKSDSFILVDSSSESDSCYEVDVTNKTIKDEVTSNERTFNEMLEKNYMTLPENVSLVESFNSNNSNTGFAAVSFHAKEVERHINEAYITKNQQPNSENLMLKHAILKKLLDSLDEPNQKHENVPIKMIANENICTTSNEKSKVDILRERFEKIKNYKAPNITENVPVKELTLEDKIKGKCNDAMWSIISMINEEFQFFFMYETIKFIVNIDRVSEIVKNVAVFTQFCKLTSDPSAIYVHSILDKKLSQAHLKSAFGQKYTILSFLDYITITEEQMRDIFNEFEDLALRYALIIDREMNATYKAVNSYLRIAFEVTFNLSDLDHITEECMSVKQIIGSVRQAEVKRLVKSCPQGIAFIRTFIMTVEEYLKKLENINKSRKCIQSAT